jgi:hypothetical protein
MNIFDYSIEDFSSHFLFAAPIQEREKTQKLDEIGSEGTNDFFKRKL